MIKNVDYEVVTSFDGQTLWVNAADGSCIGRFSKKFGIDVHKDAKAQAAGTQCLFCTHEPAGSAEWDQFCHSIFEHYSIVIEREALIF